MTTWSNLVYWWISAADWESMLWNDWDMQEISWEQGTCSYTASNSNQMWPQISHSATVWLDFFFYKSGSRTANLHACLWCFFSMQGNHCQQEELSHIWHVREFSYCVFLRALLSSSTGSLFLNGSKAACWDVYFICYYSGINKISMNSVGRTD